MSDNFLGLPFPVLAGICFIIAAGYFVMWPKPKPGQTRTPAQHFILRYAHSLVWVLVGVACLLWGSGASSIGNVLALGGLALYLFFLYTLFKVRKPPAIDH